jgi:hypothetical protein
MTETAVDLSIKRYNGVSFTAEETASSADSSMDLSMDSKNKLLGKWQGADGTEYEFSPDAGLAISSPSGDTEQYGYLIRFSALVTLGPLVDGTETVLRKHRFTQKGDKLYLVSDDVLTTLTRLE